MRKTIVVVSAVIVNEKYQFLLTKRVDTDNFNGKWQLPGGEVEFAEIPEEALKREVKEELGVEIKIKKLIPKVYSEVHGDYHLIFLVYLCQLKSLNERIILNEEASDYDWFTYQQIKKLPLLSKVKDIIFQVVLDK